MSRPTPERIQEAARLAHEVNRGYCQFLGDDSQLPYDQAVEALERWLAWARRCRIEPFVRLARSITKHRPSILAAIEHGLSNGLIESVNTKIRLITRIAFGFRSIPALIALLMLSLGGHRPQLPGRHPA